MARKKIKVNKTMAEFILSEEQTLLAKQRTMLSFIQTGLAFIGFGLVVVQFWENFLAQLVGAVLVAIGFYEIARSYKKLSEYNRRLERLKSFIKNSHFAYVEYGE